MITVIPSTADHVRELSRSLRPQDKQEAIAAGVVPGEALFYSFDHAIFRRTALIDGEVAAMWGVVGNPLGVLGQPYLVTGTKVLEISPIKFAKIYRQEVSIMKRYFSILENYVDSSYTGAVRMLEIAGFELSDPFTLPTGFSFRKFSMRGGV